MRVWQVGLVLDACGPTAAELRRPAERAERVAGVEVAEAMISAMGQDPKVFQSVESVQNRCTELCAAAGNDIHPNQHKNWTDNLITEPAQ